MRCAPLALLVLLAGCTDTGASDPAAEPADNRAAIAPPAPTEPVAVGLPVLTAEGWGPLAIGMTRAQIEAALGPDADPAAVGGPEPEQCDQFRPDRAPQDMLVMVESGRLTRISLIRDSAVRTADGLGLGATAADVRARLGEAVRASPHKYVASPAEYLDHWTEGRSGAPYVDDPAARGIRYEIGAEGRVQAIHAGGPSIQYVEGCA